MRDRLMEDVKAAMKAGDRPRLSTLRLIQAAIKDRDIANRGGGKDADSDDEILQLLAKMVKQREESAKAFEDGGRAELAATGETSRRRDAVGIDDLTPQELQVALLLTGGKTTRETAAALFLSPKTVEYHLRHVYQRLGIHSREELAARLGRPAEPPG